MLDSPPRSRVARLARSFMLVVAPGLLQHAASGRCQATLARLAHYADAPIAGGDGLAPLVCTLAGVGASAPIGALLAAGARVSTGVDTWLVAEPVTLVPGRQDVTLAGSVGDLERSECDELVTALNAHFHDDRLWFTATRPDVWLARLPGVPAVAMTPVERARGAALADLLPAGEDAARWRRWQDEIQMLLHAHPVNGEREARGRSPVNAVWFWGAGRLLDAAIPPPFGVNAPPTRLGDLARGIASLAAAGDAMPRRPLVVSRPLATGADADAFVDDTLGPALQALERGATPNLTLAADGVAGAFAWSAAAPTWVRRSLARFRARPFVAPAAAT